ncbi:MAG: DUF2309 family protein [Nitrospirae bacterium]|nr:DUF2309 family protein [Candidatus Manganitrophaceae bacterium]
MEKIKETPYSDTDRMRLRGLIRLSSEVIAHYWPMRNFVHHNPLHGLEHLPFEEAVELGNQFLGGKGYLAAERYREYLRAGRILPQQIDAALKPSTRDQQVAVGQYHLSHAQVLRACLVDGIGGAAIPEEETLHLMIDRSSDRSFIDALAGRLSAVLKPPSLLEAMRAEAEADRAALVLRVTPSTWCDRVLGGGITEQINGEIVKWCGAFLDEGQAAWPMPGREKGFYLAWKTLAAMEWSPCEIPDARRKIAALPEEPEDALLESLTALGIPSESWQEYLTLHLAALPGWTGFIKWRADQADYEWQQAYPADLTQYLAVRLWYVRELVEIQCREELGIAGTVDALSAYLQRRPGAYFLRRARVAGRLPADYTEKVDRLRAAGGAPEMQEDQWERLAEAYAAEYGAGHDLAVRRAAALRLRTLTNALAIDPASLLETPPEALKTLLDWIDAFPESEQGPVWLKALEAGYQDQLLNKLMASEILSPRANASAEGEAHAASSVSEDRALPVGARGVGASEDSPKANRAGHPIESPATQAPLMIRPQAQAVFCIDVRSEPFRRQLEGVGDYETFGFAGFFTVFIRYQGLGSHHETDQFPVIMKAKNLVRELHRPYQGRRLSRYLSGNHLLHTAHQLLVDLKENVVTPYVVVESVGWFYALPLIGKTVFTAWYRNLTERLRHALAPAIATSLTIDKLTRKEVEEMIAAEQRGIIRRALQQEFGERDLNLSLERLEALRRRALDETDPMPPTAAPPRRYALSAEEENAFIETLRTRYQINRRGLFARMERITRTGFTLQEQLFTVETALRLMGLTETSPGWSSSAVMGARRRTIRSRRRSTAAPAAATRENRTRGSSRRWRIGRSSGRGSPKTGL